MMMMIMLGCIITIINTLPIIYPIHTPLDINSTTNKCLQDEVLIPSTFPSYDNTSTVYADKCIKCT